MQDKEKFVLQRIKEGKKNVSEIIDFNGRKYLSEARVLKLLLKLIKKGLINTVLNEKPDIYKEHDIVHYRLTEKGLKII